MILLSMNGFSHVSSSQTFKATRSSYSLAKWKQMMTDTVSSAYSNSSRHLWLNSVPVPVELQLPLELPRSFHFSYLSWAGIWGVPWFLGQHWTWYRPSSAHPHLDKSFRDKHTMSFINQALSLLSWEERTEDKVLLTFETTRRQGNNSWFPSKSFAGMDAAF